MTANAATRHGLAGMRLPAAARRVLRSAVCLAVAGAISLVGFAAPTPRMHDAGQAPTEYEVKAAFLYNFAKFVEWPEKGRGAFPDANAPIVIGVLGQDPFGSSLDGIIAGKVVQGRRVQVQRFQRTDDFRQCQILYIAESEQGPVRTVLSTLAGTPVLVVSDMNNFLKQGGMVQLVMEGGKVRFEVSLAPVRSSKLKISSRMLTLARQVIG